MSVFFHGPRGGLQLSNETASTLLQAMGHELTEDSVGSMSMLDARLGMEKAKQVLRGNDLEFLCHLEVLLDDISDNWGDTLEWD